MKVAVIGAGVSGLACAHELERLGVSPAIYEQRPRCGDLYDNAAVIMQIMHRPVKNPLEDLCRNFHINIRPLNILKKVTMHAPGTSGSVCGKLGYIFKLGQSGDSITSQILGRIKTPVRYNHRADYSRLMREYDFVVAAPFTHDITGTLGCWEDMVRGWIMGARVLGSFDPAAVKMWLDTEYAGSGYAYLAPFNDRSASLVLFTTGAGRSSIRFFWERFWQKEGLDFKTVCLWDMERMVGFVYPHRVNNLLFTGNAGGFLEPLLGFGLVNAVKSGVYAARSIVQGRCYEEYLEPLKERWRISLALRKRLNRYNNKDMGRLVSFLTAPGIRQIVYNTNLDLLKYSARLNTRL